MWCRVVGLAIASVLSTAIGKYTKTKDTLGEVVLVIKDWLGGDDHI
jgi:hypothetical protein